MFEPDFIFVFHSLIVLGSLTWRTNYFRNQLKHKAVPFLAYLWSIIIPRSEILREVMSVYQSSMLGNEDYDERDTGFRQVLDIMVTPVYLQRHPQEDCQTGTG